MNEYNFKEGKRGAVVRYRDKIDHLVNNERARQDEKWGVQSWPNGTGKAYELTSLTFRKACDRATELGQTTWSVILLEEVYEALAESGGDSLKTELVQVMAVCKAWLEDLEKKK